MTDAPLVIAAASPCSRIVCADGWPLIPEGEYNREDMAAGLITTIESPASDTGCAIIVAAIRVLLGEIGCKSYLDDVRARRSARAAFLRSITNRRVGRSGIREFLWTQVVSATWDTNGDTAVLLY